MVCTLKVIMPKVCKIFSPVGMLHYSVYSMKLVLLKQNKLYINVCKNKQTNKPCKNIPKLLVELVIRGGLSILNVDIYGKVWVFTRSMNYLSSWKKLQAKWFFLFLSLSLHSSYSLSPLLSILSPLEAASFLGRLPPLPSPPIYPLWVVGWEVGNWYQHFAGRI